MTRKLAGELDQEFGGRVEVRYVDVDETGLDSYPSMNRVLQMGYPYPVTLIDGEPRFAGGIMTPQIKESLREIIDQDKPE